jgi:hypothetical protein
MNSWLTLQDYYRTVGDARSSQWDDAIEWPEYVYYREGAGTVEVWNIFYAKVVTILFKEWL